MSEDLVIKTRESSQEYGVREFSGNRVARNSVLAACSADGFIYPIVPTLLFCNFTDH